MWDSGLWVLTLYSEGTTGFPVLLIASPTPVGFLIYGSFIFHSMFLKLMTFTFYSLTTSMSPSLTALV